MVQMNKSDLVFQLCCYHDKKSEEMEKLKVSELRKLLNSLLEARR
jgi:hypothetical protein